MAEQRSLKIEVPLLARVEGEGALDLEIEQGRLVTARLRIFEPPRFFEKLVEGRRATEMPDLVARICGICPVAYQMTAAHALESIAGLRPGPWVREMRRLLYCGEWIESHCLHIHLLAAPDLLGHRDAASMAREHPEVVRRGLALQRLGNEIIALLGGRSVHPVGVCLGGFHQAPSLQAVSALRGRLHDALPLAEDLVRWTASLSLPAVDQSFVSVALRHPLEYPLNEGRIASSAGLDIDAAEFDLHFAESQVPHSTALLALHHGRPYLVGPLARLNLNADRLPPAVQRSLARTCLQWPSSNPYHAIVARAVEVHYALVEALRILDDYHRPDAASVAWVAQPGTACAATEAPRGLLWNRWQLGDDARVASCRIVPPTSQNQARIEEDLRLSMEALGLDQPAELLRQRAEAVIRNYDPCISCATHFLTLRVRREGVWT